MPPRRQVNLHVGHTYGVGSLLYRARTVVALRNRGTIVEYRAEDAPLTASGQGRTEGKTYTCKRGEFLRWLNKVAAEQSL